ncbi:hypothetical protein B5F08_09215 [Anaeromassilibacillus sp. An172]|uniref:DUF6465 family protein n=1 Tax=Anaeromassilibacillus sp. An172 TaxID=1965570 RepID=UPI000B3A3190|nr:DUF6465 family protein [Anaeromassilibacillus sp. An172]OUP77171.1 hypothetical protein B5F08_09215 [Anaeromassilibacillus sp. An172]
MATTKKTAPEAAKTETAKVEAVKAEEAVETVTAADTKVEEVAAPAKATAKKTTKKAATKKTTTKKAAKKEEAAEVAAPAATTEIFVEYNGVQVSGEEIVRLVKGSYGKDVTDLKIYVKPEDNRAYYVADGEAGSVRVLFI